MTRDDEPPRKPVPDRSPGFRKRRLYRRLGHRLPPWAPRTALPGLLFAAIVPAIMVFSGLGTFASMDNDPPTAVLERLEVETRITDGLGVTQVTGEYWNPNPDNASETRIDFPFPASAVLTEFTLETHNDTFIGIVYERSLARTSYEEAVDRGEHAVLLESAEGGRLTLRVNIPAQERATLQMTYAQILPLRHGQYEYTFPLDQIVPDGGTELTYDIYVTNTHNQSGVTTSGLDMQTVSQEPGFLHQRNENPLPPITSPFRVQIRPETQGYVSSVAISGYDQNATAVFQVLPSMEDASALAMDLVFLVDTSGSMANGNKMGQAQDAMNTILDELREQDRFVLAEFSSEAELHEDQLQNVAPDSIDSAHTWVDGLTARGGTGIDKALETAFGVLAQGGHGEGEDNPRLPVIVLITDGEPTEGVTDPGQIVGRVDGWNTFGARLHTVGIGFDQNNAFLNELAAANQGIYRAMERSADAGEEIAGFYNEIGTPLLRDVEIQLPGLDATDVHPDPLGDVFAGSHVVLAAHVDTSGLPADIDVVVTGTTADGDFNQTLTIRSDDVHLVDETDRLWARQKALTLERQIQLDLVDGESARLELLVHGLEHQLATSMTSWLIVQEDEIDEVRANITKKLEDAEAGLREIEDKEGQGSQDGIIKTSPSPTADDSYAFFDDDDDAGMGSTGPDDGDSAFRRSEQDDSQAAGGYEESTPSVQLAGVVMLAGLATVLALIGRRRS